MADDLGFTECLSNNTKLLTICRKPYWSIRSTSQLSLNYPLFVRLFDFSVCIFCPPDYLTKLIIRQLDEIILLTFHSSKWGNRSLVLSVSQHPLYYMPHECRQKIERLVFFLETWKILSKNVKKRLTLSISSFAGGTESVSAEGEDIIEQEAVPIISKELICSEI